MIYTVIYILISLIITEYIAKGSIKKLLLLNPLYIILTTIIIYIIILPLLMLFNNITWLILLLTSIILLSLGVSNKIKIDYRQTGFTPIDFLILKEATSMSGALNKKSMKVLFIKFSLILILFTALTFYFKNKFNIVSIDLLLSLLLASILILIFIILGPKFNYRLNVFKTGIVIFFLSYFRDPVRLEKRKVTTTNINHLKFKVEDNEETPDIVIIQSESFSDPTFLGMDNFTSDPLPFFHSIKDDVYSFNMSTRAFGGGTVNTEFEILTGLSTVFFPRDTTVFSRYIKKPLSSIGSILKKHGYNSVLIHPYESWYYNRVKSYQNLGFDKFISNKGFDLPKEGYVNDEDVNDKIIENLDKGYNFIFAVTMQNHTPYNIGSNNNIRYLKNIKNEETNVHFNNYLSGLKKSDIALESLITKLKERKKKTILLFYGDHLPIINQDPNFYEDVSWTKSKLGSKNYYYDLSLSPGFIWTNHHKKLKNVFAKIDSTIVINKLLKEIGLTYPTYIDDILNLFGKEKITSFHRDFLMKNNKLYSYNTLEYIEFHKKLKQITTDVFYDEHYANWTYYNEEFNLD